MGFGLCLQVRSILLVEAKPVRHLRELKQNLRLIAKFDSMVIRCHRSPSKYQISHNRLKEGIPDLVFLIIAELSISDTSGTVLLTSPLTKILI